MTPRPASCGRPTPPKWAKLSENLDPLFRSSVGLEEIYYDDGTVGIRLEDRYQSMMLTHRDASGLLAADLHPRRPAGGRGDPGNSGRRDPQ